MKPNQVRLWVLGSHIILFYEVLLALMETIPCMLFKTCFHPNKRSDRQTAHSQRIKWKVIKLQERSSIWIFQFALVNVAVDWMSRLFNLKFSPGLLGPQSKPQQI